VGPRAEECTLHTIILNVVTCPMYLTDNDVFGPITTLKTGYIIFIRVFNVSVISGPGIKCPVGNHKYTILCSSFLNISSKLVTS
jgi:hypothetical protein